MNIEGPPTVSKVSQVCDAVAARCIAGSRVPANRRADGESVASGFSARMTVCLWLGGEVEGEGSSASFPASRPAAAATSATFGEDRRSGPPSRQRDPKAGQFSYLLGQIYSVRLRVCVSLEAANFHRKFSFF